MLDVLIDSIGNAPCFLGVSRDANSSKCFIKPDNCGGEIWVSNHCWRHVAVAGDLWLAIYYMNNTLLLGLGGYCMDCSSIEWTLGHVHQC